MINSIIIRSANEYPQEFILEPYDPKKTTFQQWIEENLKTNEQWEQWINKEENYKLALKTIEQWNTWIKKKENYNLASIYLLNNLDIFNWGIETFRDDSFLIKVHERNIVDPKILLSFHNFLICIKRDIVINWSPKEERERREANGELKLQTQEAEENLLKYKLKKNAPIIVVLIVLVVLVALGLIGYSILNATKKKIQINTTASQKKTKASNKPNKYSIYQKKPKNTITNTYNQIEKKKKNTITKHKDNQHKDTKTDKKKNNNTVAKHKDNKINNT